MSGLFGGSKQQSLSQNVNNPMLTGALSGALGGVGDSYNASKALLGGDNSGFNRYKDAAGYNFAAQQGSQGVLANGAARGLLRSGATGKGLVSFGQKLSDQYLDSYLQRLTGMGQLGLGAGQILASSGQRSESSGKSKPGLGGFLGGLFGGIGAG